MPSPDLLLLTLPPNWLDDPPAGSAVLKSAVQNYGLTCQFVDFSLYCYEKVFSKNYREYLEWCQIFPGVYDLNNASKKHLDLLHSTVEICVEMILKIAPRAVGLSVFSHWQHRFSFLLCQKIKSSVPGIKIIMGGIGGSSTPKGLEYFTQISYFEKNINFIHFMSRRRLIDHGVINDGEEELIRILQNLDGYKTDLIPKEANFKTRLLPDYDDHHLDDYFYINNQKKLIIRGSKGCVRQCVFCDEHRAYTKFFFDQGDEIANEMIELSHRYGVRKFQFADSLVNGSLPSFRKMISTLVAYNLINPDRSIVWHGNYICRSNNHMSDQDYDLLKKSGAHALTIGVESGSDKVLAEMKKNTTVADLLYEIGKFEQFGINCYLLFMIGFYNETWQDFLSTVNLLKTLQPFVASGTVDSVLGGRTFMISDWQPYNKDDFDIDPQNPFNWVHKKNPNCTMEERCRRRVIFQEVCDELAIPVAHSHADLQILENILTHRHDINDVGSIDAHN